LMQEAALESGLPAPDFLYRRMGAAV